MVTLVVIKLHNYQDKARRWDTSGSADRERVGAPEFIERKLPVVPRPSPPTAVARTEQPRTPAAAQAMLPLFDAPAGRPIEKPKEASVWDESKGLNEDTPVFRTYSLHVSK